jgi:hypothetical protein
MPRAAVLALCVLLPACAGFPDVEAAEHGLADSPPPQLLPTADILARAAIPGRAEAAGDSVAARAARLKTRAALLRAMPIG